MNKDNKFNNLIGWIRDNYSDKDISLEQNESGNMDCNFSYEGMQFYIFYYYPDRIIDFGIITKYSLCHIATIDLVNEKSESIRDIFRYVLRTVHYMRRKINE